MLVANGENDVGCFVGERRKRGGNTKSADGRALVHDKKAGNRRRRLLSVLSLQSDGLQAVKDSEYGILIGRYVCSTIRTPIMSSPDFPPTSSDPLSSPRIITRPLSLFQLSVMHVRKQALLNCRSRAEHKPRRVTEVRQAKPAEEARPKLLPRVPGLAPSSRSQERSINLLKPPTSTRTSSSG